MAQFKRKELYALMNAVMSQLTGVETLDVIDTKTFMDAGELAKTYKTDEIFNALGIVGARLMIAARPYSAQFKLLDSIDTGDFNSTVREISYYSTNALPSGAYNSDLFTNLADGFDAGTNPDANDDPQSTGDQWEQHPVHPLEMYFMDSQIWQDCLTRYNKALKIVFNSEDEFDNFWSGLLTEKANDIEQRKEAYKRLTFLSRCGLAAAMGDPASAIAGAYTAVDCTKEFNDEFGTNYTGTELRTTYRKEFYEWLTSKFQIDSDMMEERSGYFHFAPPLTLADGDHYILRHTPKADQKMIVFSDFWKKAKTTVMPEIFNDQYLKQENFETVKFWQNFSMKESDKATANLKVTIPGWLMDAISGGDTTVDTEYTFNPDYILGAIFDRRACMVDFQLDDVRPTGVEARKNYQSNWYDFVRSNICNPTHNFILYYMSENIYTVKYDKNGGTGSVADQSVAQGEAITLSDGTGLTAPAGKVLSKWNTKADGSGTDYALGASTTPTEDLTLYAIYANA